MQPKICLALGGGAARGLAHLGVLKAFEESGIPINLVAGTSFGALIGGIYSTRPDASYWMASIEEFLRKAHSKSNQLSFLHRLEQPRKPSSGFVADMANLIRKGYFWGMTATRPAFVPAADYEAFLLPIVPEILIQDAPIPFCCVAADIERGQKVIFRDGPLRRAISASCALPGVFPPVREGERLLVDGGWVERVPVRSGRQMGADVVIAVDVSAEMASFRKRSGLDVILRADAVTRIQLNEIICREADVVIRPVVGNVHWADFTRPSELFAEGERVARESLGEIRRAIAVAYRIPKRVIRRIRNLRDRFQQSLMGGKC